MQRDWRKQGCNNDENEHDGEKRLTKEERAQFLRGMGIALLGVAGSSSSVSVLLSAMRELTSSGERTLAALALLNMPRSQSATDSVGLFLDSLAREKVIHSRFQESAQLLAPDLVITQCEMGHHLSEPQSLKAVLEQRFAQVAAPPINWRGVERLLNETPRSGQYLRPSWQKCGTSAQCYMHLVEEEEKTTKRGPALWFFGFYATREEAMSLIPFLSTGTERAYLMTRILGDRIDSPSHSLVKRIERLASSSAEPIATSCGSQRSIWELSRRFRWRYGDLKSKKHRP